MNKLSFNGKRIVGAVVLLIFLLCVANYYLDVRFFGRFNREVLIVSGVLMAIYLRYFGPTMRELQDYRDAKRKH